MSIQKKVVIFIIGFIVVGFLISFGFPKEKAMNENAEIRIGAGDDLSGVLMKETVELLSETYEITGKLIVSGLLKQSCSVGTECERN